jgi:multisubunit Na+/H+ antiporter MnhB subunit
MVAVLVTAIATWLILLVLDNVNVGSFLLESTIAVLGGAAIGLLVPWFMRRRRRSAT